MLFLYTDATALKAAHFGAGEGPIILKGLACVGNEDQLLSCPINFQQEQHCTHNMDASVACSRKSQI